MREINLEFIETPTFTKRVTEILTLEEYAEFQLYLAGNLEKGALIQGGGGIRKIRWNINGQGKSGGVRIIYYHLDRQNAVHLIFIFKKNEQSNLTAVQKAMLKELVKGYKNAG